jgi:hypothetical protein
MYKYYLCSVVLSKDPVQIDAGPLPASAWAASAVEVEAAKDLPCCQLMLRAVQLLSEVYTSCGGEGF